MGKAAVGMERWQRTAVMGMEREMEQAAIEETKLGNSKRERQGCISLKRGERHPRRSIGSITETLRGCYSIRHPVPGRASSSRYRIRQSE